jgi:diguanylate cyclase (GGDEF)-like protein
VSPLQLDFSARGRPRVYLLTVLGTLLCIGVAFLLDSYSLEEGWRWGEDPINNLIIPLVLAPPFFYLLLSKLRELAIAHHELLVISATDSLTSCFNRRAFTTLVDGYLQKLEERNRTAGALLVIDVDHFKAVNDNFGHDTGDEALRLIADVIRGSVRDGDIVGRLGGEEFSVFLPVSNARLTATIAERIRAAVQALRFAPFGQLHPLTVSIGGAGFIARISFRELYRNADERLYGAKRDGRNRIDIAGLSPEAPPTALAS